MKIRDTVKLREDFLGTVSILNTSIKKFRTNWTNLIGTDQNQIKTDHPNSHLVLLILTSILYRGLKIINSRLFLTPKFFNPYYTVPRSLSDLPVLVGPYGSIEVLL